MISVRRKHEAVQRPIENLSKSDSTVVHFNLITGLVLQSSLEKHLLFLVLNRESLGFRVHVSKHFVNGNNVEVEVVGNAIGSHGVVTYSQVGVGSQLEKLKEEEQQFIRKYLGQALFGK